VTNLTYRYPTHLIDVVVLADASRVVIRPALPQDSDLQRAFVRNLSDEARYFRFMTRLSELPEAMAQRFTSIDYRSHVALIATISEAAGETMIGEARYIVDACEFAIAVADDAQGIGLASTLLGRLVDHAAASGINRISADTLSAVRIGFTVARKREDGRMVRLVKDLPAHKEHATVCAVPAECTVAA